VSPVKPSVLILPPPSESEVKAELRVKWEDRLRSWLRQLPFAVQQAVVRSLLEEVEKQMEDDKDRKIILALINIERTRPPDLFFGLNSLLSVMQDTGIRHLPISTRMWFCMWEFDQVTNSNIIQIKIGDTLHRMTNLVQVNLAHIATDELW
jgi:hypothetical protein